TRFSRDWSSDVCSSDLRAGWSDHLIEGVAERGHLRGGADRDPQPARGSGLADQYAAVQQTLPDRVPVGEPTEEREVRIRVGHLEPPPAQPLHAGVPLATQVVDPA